jgi:hypothetical protein
MISFDHVLLRFAHLENLTRDCVWGHGWVLFPGIPILAFAMLIAYSAERFFEVMPVRLRQTLVFLLLFGLSLVASTGVFGAVSVKSVEVVERDRTEQMLAFLDPHFCAAHPEVGFCRARKYFKL